ncbi:MAG: hypothetical protein M4D80_19835 [Myxococcota bacterium]|nr:hypothetical protein [Myxococcota bacterium]
MADAPLAGMANIPYDQEPYPPRLSPRASLPVLWTMAAAVLALLLFILLRS